MQMATQCFCVTSLFLYNHKAMIIDIEDKVTAQESEYGIESIVNYELATRDSRIEACAELLVTAIEKTQ